MRRVMPAFRQFRANRAQAATAGAQTAAQEAARAQYDLVDVIDPATGDTRRVPRASVLSGAGNTASLNPATAEARASLGKVQTQADQMLKTIDLALGHKGLEDAVGIRSYNPLTLVRGSDRSNFDVIRQQLEGQTFLQAFESLKGGGVITNIEGDKATQAIARLGTAQSPEAYREALGDLKGVINTGLERARKSARIESASRQESGGVARIQSQDQYQSLPSGSLFIAPDGTTRRKP